MKKPVLIIMIILMFGLVSFLAFGQTTGKQLISFDFVDQQIREILYAFSTYSKVSIIGDDTVTGTGSFQYNGPEFEKAFDSFLLANRLFAEKNPDVWVVSKIRINVSNTGKIILDSYDAAAAQIFDKLSRKTGAAIITDILPASGISVHLEASGPNEAAELVMKPFTDYMVEVLGNYIHIKKNPAPFPPMLAAATGKLNIKEENGIFDAEIEQSRIRDVLDKFFQTAKREYVSFLHNDQTIDRIKFSGKRFEQALDLILELGSGECREIGSMYYIFPVQQSEIIGSIKNEGKSWQLFRTRYRQVTEVLSILQIRFGSIQTIAMSNNHSFLAFVTDELFADINEFIHTIDAPGNSESIRLKYIKTEDLFRSLPPSARREELIDAGDSTTFFYTGSGEQKALFLKDLEIIDRPQPRIRYDLFIIQVQDSTNLNWNVQAEARPVRPGDRNMVTGRLGNLLNLNFDIITVFGYQFAAKLNAAISDNQASVFADTTLFGLSGQEIKFQNTSTYRYRDSNIDPDTGKPIYSGVTREIVSGLVLEIKGWVSGDGMITTTVSASVSKRGADVSSSAGNPPPTSEKVLTTQVRARSGETVVLSGLRQNDSTIIEQRTPFISKIPILGWLFKTKDNTAENTQMIIYLVPHVDLSNNENDGKKISSLYARFVEPLTAGGNYE
ncbi:MAG: type II and III secretion system protein [Treponema sp.]|nr:type II and III secretion system protein [Treponema sp.]